MSHQPGESAPQVGNRTDWPDLIENLPETALEQSGMPETAYRSSSIVLRELTGIALLRIHSLQAFATLRDTMAACDILLPAEVNQSQGQDPAAICLAPGEWLLFSEYLGPGRLSAQVQPAVDLHHTAALDLTDGFAVFRLSGTGAPWLLSKLCALDFQRGAAAAHAARTQMQQAAVTLHYHRPGGLTTESVFDLIVDRSIAAYLWQILLASIPHAEELEEQFGAGP